MRTIAHISDLHFGITDPRIVEGLVADLSQRTPSLLVASGDLTQRARAGQFRQAAEFLARLPRPQLVLPGNHDVPLWDISRRIVAPLKNYRKYITTDLWPEYRDAELLVVGINTARRFSFRLLGYWKDGGISTEQLEDLRLRVRGSDPGLFKIVVTHHPFIPPSPKYAGDVVRGAARALDVMAECGIDLLLAGHLHTGYSGDVRGHHETALRSILSVQAGTATSKRRRGQPNGYNWITIEPDRVSIEARSWDGARFAASSTSLFARRDGIWQQKSV